MKESKAEMSQNENVWVVPNFGEDAEQVPLKMMTREEADAFIEEKWQEFIKMVSCYECEYFNVYSKDIDTYDIECCYCDKGHFEREHDRDPGYYEHMPCEDFHMSIRVVEAKNRVAERNAKDKEFNELVRAVFLAKYGRK